LGEPRLAKQQRRGELFAALVQTIRCAAAAAAAGAFWEYYNVHPSLHKLLKWLDAKDITPHFDSREACAKRSLELVS
jgi:hypothetical protein